MTELEEIIPSGPYCYANGKVCPYWEHIESYKAKCNYLKAEDGRDGMDLLWDQIKSCDVNNLDEDLDESI